MPVRAAARAVLKRAGPSEGVPRWGRSLRSNTCAAWMTGCMGTSTSVAREARSEGVAVVDEVNIEVPNTSPERSNGGEGRPRKADDDSGQHEERLPCEARLCVHALDPAQARSAVVLRHDACQRCYMGTGGMDERAKRKQR